MLGRPESAIHHRGGERKPPCPWQHEPREPAPLSEGSDAAERASAGRAKAESPAPAPTRPVRSAHIYRYGSRADPRAAATAIYSIYHSIYIFSPRRGARARERTPASACHYPVTCRRVLASLGTTPTCVCAVGAMASRVVCIPPGIRVTKARRVSATTSPVDGRAGGTRPPSGCVGPVLPRSCRRAARFASRHAAAASASRHACGATAIS